MRHAIAEPHGTPGFADEDRPLTSEGRRKMKAIARGMQAMGLEFDRLISSPYPRARQTAEIVSAAFSLDIDIWDSLKPDIRPQQTVAALARAPEERVLIVGHQPHLGALVSLLIAGDPGAGIELKKGGLCKLTMDAVRSGRSATLEWLMTPSLLRQIGRRR